MRFLILVTLGLASLGAAADSVVAQAPVARADTFRVATGTLLERGGGTLLLNDDRGLADSLRVELVTEPANGATSVAADGSFWYTPSDGFSGLDSLTYRLRSVPTVRMTIDSLRSQMSLSATLTIPNAVTDEYAGTTGLAGELRLLTVPGAMGVDSVRVLEMDVVNTDSLRMRFDYGDFGVPVLTVNLSAGPRAISLGMGTPGPTAPVGFANFFSQVFNELLVAGDVAISGSGILGGLVPSGDEQFDTSTTSDLSGIATLAGRSSELSLTISLEQEVDLSGNAVLLRISGEVLASGGEPLSAVSNEATVYFQVVSGVGTETVSPDAPLVDVYPNPAVGIVYVSTSTRGGWHVEIVDVLGRTLITGDQRRGPGRATVDVASLAPGAYLVLVRGDTGGLDVSPLVVFR